MPAIKFPILPLCVLCLEVTIRENYCHGCRCIICERCDPTHNNTMGRKHVAEDHQHDAIRLYRRPCTAMQTHHKDLITRCARLAGHDGKCRMVPT